MHFMISIVNLTVEHMHCSTLVMSTVEHLLLGFRGLSKGKELPTAGMAM